jgi:beta-ribofuranosylaminobenzene 5'-phosphate synthase
VRHELPDRWRIVLAIPDADPGLEGDAEARSMRSAVQGGESALAAEIADLVDERLLPSASQAELEAFGGALSAFNRLNGAWYTAGQNGAFSDPAGRIIERMADADAVAGIGQSSWGPAVWILTDNERATRVKTRLEKTNENDFSTLDVRILRIARRGRTATTHS